MARLDEFLVEFSFTTRIYYRLTPRTLTEQMVDLGIRSRLPRTCKPRAAMLSYKTTYPKVENLAPTTWAASPVGFGGTRQAMSARSGRRAARGP
jgi:hypothetical protein